MRFLWDTINWTTLRHFRLVDLFTAWNYLFYSYYFSVIQQSVVPSTSLPSRVFSDLQKYINFSLSTAQPDIDCISHCNPKESEMNQVCFEKMTNEIATARDTIPITKYCTTSFVVQDRDNNGFNVKVIMVMQSTIVHWVHFTLLHLLEPLYHEKNGHPFLLANIG